MILLKKCFIKELVTNITFIFKHQTKKLVRFTDSKIENPAKFNGNIGNILFLACNFVDLEIRVICFLCEIFINTEIL